MMIDPGRREGERFRFGPPFLRNGDRRPPHPSLLAGEYNLNMMRL